jgi:aryl-alcohol dehydrogenase-like predicted oxidoreductase
MRHCTRRDFFKSGLAAAALAGSGVRPALAAKKSYSDFVPLGKTGVQVTRLAFGTGTNNGNVQARLGQDEFTRLIHYAYDHGIRFFETAESYRTPAMLGEALKGYPRDSYRLMTKMTIRPNDDYQARLDSFRTTLNTEYFDILLMHCMQTPTWPEDTKRAQDALSEAKVKQVILAKGASVHGLPALAEFPGNQWLDLAMIRMNHTGWRMDTPPTRDYNALGDVNQVVATVQKVKQQGLGVISMKLAGEGAFTNPDDRQAALKFAFNHAGVDAVTIGYKSTAEIDEAMQNVDLALNG